MIRRPGAPRHAAVPSHVFDAKLVGVLGAATVVLAFVCSVPQPALAQAPRQGGGASELQQRLQQLMAERNALQAENERLKREAADFAERSRTRDREGAELQSKARAAEAVAARARAEGDTAAAALAASQDRLTELVGKFRELGENLRSVEAERAKLAGEMAARGDALGRCTAANAELVSILDDVLTRYENVGIGTVLAGTEPFTRLTRTRIENLVDEYRARASSLDLKMPTAER